MNLQDLKRNLKNIWAKNKDVLFDIVVIGSAEKGKESLKDVDVALIFKARERVEETNKLARQIDRSVHVSHIFLDELYTQPLWHSVLREGYSVSSEKKLLDLLGMAAFGLFTYSLKGMKPNIRSRFSQVLSGYKSEPVLKQTEAVVLTPGAVLVPITKVEKFRSFLEYWKASYTLKYVWVES